MYAIFNINSFKRKFDVVQANFCTLEKGIVLSAIKLMATVFWDSKGIIFIDTLEKGQIISGQYYAEVLQCLRTKCKINNLTRRRKESCVIHLPILARCDGIRTMLWKIFRSWWRFIWKIKWKNKLKIVFLYQAERFFTPPSYSLQKPSTEAEFSTDV